MVRVDLNKRNKKALHPGKLSESDLKNLFQKHREGKPVESILETNGITSESFDIISSYVRAPLMAAEKDQNERKNNKETFDLFK